MGNLLRCIEHYSHPHINRAKWQMEKRKRNKKPFKYLMCVR